MPHYRRTPADPDASARTVARPDVLRWCLKPGGEGYTFDMLSALKRIQCPTLVIGGEDDPMTPIESQREIAASLPAHLVRFESFAGCGHGVVPDARQRGVAVIGEFITRETAA